MTMRGLVGVLPGVRVAPALCALRPFGSLSPWWTWCPDGRFGRGTGDRHDTRGQSPAAIVLMALELDFLAGSECIEGLRPAVNR